jgi:hypothetical protein
VRLRQHSRVSYKLCEFFLSSCEISSSLLCCSINSILCLVDSVAYSALSSRCILVYLCLKIIDLTAAENTYRNDHQAYEQNGKNVSFHDFVSFH